MGLELRMHTESNLTGQMTTGGQTVVKDNNRVELSGEEPKVRNYTEMPDVYLGSGFPLFP